MPKRSRDKQLAKLAQRRQAERRAAKRRRDLTIGLVAGGIALILVAVGAFILFGGGDDQTDAASPSVSAEPGTQTGTVTPQCDRAKVACGGTVPRRRQAQAARSTAPPKMTIDPSTSYTATIETSCGTIEIELLPKIGYRRGQQLRVPGAAGLLRRLSLPPDRGGLRDPGRRPAGDRHRWPGLSSSPSPRRRCQLRRTRRARLREQQTGANGSQFFFTLAPTPNLDPPQQYTIFGTVTKGHGCGREDRAAHHVGARAGATRARRRARCTSTR